MKMNMFEEHMLKEKQFGKFSARVVDHCSIFFKGITWTYWPGAVQTLIFFRLDVSIFQWVVDGMMEWAIHKMI